jgi:hypothetical protein
MKLKIKTMRIHIITLWLLFVSVCSYAQPTFKKTHGGAGNEQATSLALLPDGSFVVAGRSDINGDEDALLVKFDADGNVEWSKLFGSAENDFFTIVKSTPDGGFIATGSTLSNSTGGDLLAVKCDASGNLVWQRHFGSATALDDGRGIGLLPDGYLFSGYSLDGGSAIYTVKTDLNGNLVWANTSTNLGIGGESIRTNSGEIWVASGYTGDGAIVKLDNNGNVIGTSQWSGAGNEALYHIKKTGDGFLLSDHSWVPSGNSQLWPWLLKLNNSGAVLWSKCYNFGENGRCIAEPTSDGGAIFGSYFLGQGARIIKTNASGDVVWAKLHTYPNNGNGHLYQVMELSSGGYIGIGFCNVSGNGTDIFVIKTDAQGEITACCPSSFSVSVVNYTPSLLNPATSTVVLNDNAPATLADLGISLTTTDRCNGPSCCITDAGTMSGNNLSLCTNLTANFTHNGNQVLDANDLLRFILFSNPADTAGSIIATSSTPSFTFNPATMQTGVTYYIAAMAGNGVNGNVDLNDPCLDFSNAIQLIWRPLPAVTFAVANPNVCAGGCTSVTATFTGTPPFTLTYTTPGNGLQTQSFSGNTGTFQVCVPAGTPAGSFQIAATKVVDVWCTCE